jgi:hypothetical protein
MTASAPRRHQRPARGGPLKGWTKPDGAVMALRPYQWGNPHRFDKPCLVLACQGVTHTRPECIAAFEADLVAGTLITAPGRPPLGLDDVRQLAGRDVVCGCDLDQLCHADVILRYANTRTERKEGL